MASYYERLKSQWFELTQVETNRPWAQKLKSGEMDLCHYMGFLLETYHNTAYNPQLQAFATMYIKGNPREIVKKFFLHASSEVSHDLLAKTDLMNLGVKGEWIEKSRPLSTTTAFQAFAIYNIQFVNPLCYLGYLFHLEMSPTINGQGIIDLLKSKGVPSSALSFLEEHAAVDVNHLKMMVDYVDQLVQSEKDFEVLSNSLRDCMFLHTRVLEAAFENGERLWGAQSAATKATLNTAS